MRKSLKKKNEPFAVTVGLENSVGLHTSRSLKRCGVAVIGITKNPKHYCARTNACERIVTADIDSETLIDTLVDLGRGFPEKAILFPCTDRCVLIISRYRDRLASLYEIALPDPETVEMLLNKQRFYDFAATEGLPIPRFALLRNRNEAEEAADSFRFPIILKPALKSADWDAHVKTKAFKIQSPDEFIRTYDRCAGWAEVLMIQEWITGGDHNNYSCNAYFDADANALVTFTARKLRQYPPETGSTCLGEECRSDVLLNTSLDLFKRVGFHGLAYLEMKKDDRTGEYVIIEPNIGRPTGRSSLAEACDVELVYTQYCHLAGLPLPKNRTQKYVGKKWIHLRTDFESAWFYWRRGDLTLAQWLRSIRGKKFFAILSIKDPVPFFAQFQMALEYKFGNPVARLMEIIKPPASGGDDGADVRIEDRERQKRAA